MREAIANAHTCGNGPFTKKCCDLLEPALAVPKVVLTTSCTHALEMSGLLLNLKATDEVILPAFAFVSTANAFALHGARPVFCDIRPDTLNLDETKLEGLITDRTKAIIALHYAGVGCEMDAIMEIARRHGIAVIEDNAHGLFAKYREKHLGTFGCFATQSFHETKNFNCGEGGALLINDPQYIERAEIILEKGTDRSRFFRGQVDKYSWVDIGSSYLPSELLAAYLLVQLEAREQIQNKRRQIWEYYDQHLSDWAGEHNIRPPIVPEHCEQAYHMFYLLMPSLDTRHAFIKHLRAHNIISAFHYVPLNSSRMGMKFGGTAGDCPITEDLSARLVRLPFYYDLTESDLERVVATVRQFECSKAEKLLSAAV